MRCEKFEAVWFSRWLAMLAEIGREGRGGRDDDVCSVDR